MHEYEEKAGVSMKNLTPNTASASTNVFDGFPLTAVNHKKFVS